MAPEATKVGSSLAVDTVTIRHLVLDARRAVDSLRQVRDTICPAWIGEAGRKWLDTGVRSADIALRLLGAAIRRHDPTRFLSRLDLLCGLRILLDEAPDLVRSESRLVFGALDDIEVTLRALRTSLCIHGRNPNPAAAARIRQVLAIIAADLDAAERAFSPSDLGGGKSSGPFNREIVLEQMQTEWLARDSSTAALGQLMRQSGVSNSLDPEWPTE